jgi:hypothetical protein
MIIREYRIEHRFSPGEKVIEFTPERSGRFLVHLLDGYNPGFHYRDRGGTKRRFPGPQSPGLNLAHKSWMYPADTSWGGRIRTRILRWALEM